MFWRFTLGFIAISLLSQAQAGTYACGAIPVTIPCEQTHWDLGFSAFFVEATSNENAFASTVFDNSYDGGEYLDDLNTKYHTLEPKHEFGYEVELSFHFGTGNDIIFQWESLDKSNEGTAVKTVDDAILSPYPGPFVDLNTKNVKARDDFDFDAINFEFGQHINLGEHLLLRTFVGFQYARIIYTRETVATTPAFDIDAETVILTNRDRLKSDFGSFGPRIGGDLTYECDNGFSVVGHAAISLLVGDIDTDGYTVFKEENLTTPDDTFLVKNAFWLDSNVNIIPAAMFKTGISYTTPIRGGAFFIEGGWRWEGYFHSMRFVTDAGANYNNFTFHGPYVAVRYLG